MGMNWKGIFWLARKTLSENRQAVLFAGGVVGVVSCGILAAKASPNASKRMADIRKERDYRLDEIETNTLEEYKAEKSAVTRRYISRTVKEVVPKYVPAVVAGGGAIASFALSNRDLAKKAAGAAAACAVVEKTLGAYQDKVIGELGEEVHERILEAVVNDVPEDVVKLTSGKVGDDDTANAFPHDVNDKLYYDHVTGRIFWSSDEKIKDAESTVNKLLIDVGVATLNDFYSALLLDCDSVIGDAIGWRVDDPHARNMDVIFGSRLDRENNIPLITIGYRTCAVNLRELERR